MKKIFYLLVLFLFSISSMAKQVDLSGTWNLNKEKSTLNEQFSMAPGKMVLSQTSDSLNVEKHSEFQGQEYTIKDRFALDGKECINKGWMDSKKTSTLAWSEDGNTLTVSSKVPMQDGGEVSIKETYQIEENRLKVVVSASSSMGEMTETYVLDKQ